MPEINLGSCGCRFAFQCEDDDIAALITSAFGGLILAASALPPTCRYRIDREEGAFRVSGGPDSVRLEDDDSLLFHIDKTLIIELQLQRPDLFFLHAAVVVWSDRAVILSAPPGTGKSTLTLAALREGLNYLSDELAPIDLRQLTVQPYPHALCLKSHPPPPETLPAGALRYGERFHLPLEALPAATRFTEAAIAALIFLKRDAHRFEGLRSLTIASAVVRLLANGLNLLAHPGDGADAAVSLAQALPCFELDITDLQAAGRTLKSFLADQLVESDDVS